MHLAGGQGHSLPLVHSLTYDKLSTIDIYKKITKKLPKINILPIHFNNTPLDLTSCSLLYDTTSFLMFSKDKQIDLEV